MVALPADCFLSSEAERKRQVLRPIRSELSRTSPPAYTNVGEKTVTSTPGSEGGRQTPDPTNQRDRIRSRASHVHGPTRRALHARRRLLEATLANAQGDDGRSAARGVAIRRRWSARALARRRRLQWREQRGAAGIPGARQEVADAEGAQRPATADWHAERRFGGVYDAASTPCGIIAAAPAAAAAAVIADAAASATCGLARLGLLRKERAAQQRQPPRLGRRRLVLVAHPSQQLEQGGGRRRRTRRAVSRARRGLELLTCGGCAGDPDADARVRSRRLRLPRVRRAEGLLLLEELQGRRPLREPQVRLLPSVGGGCGGGAAG